MNKRSWFQLHLSTAIVLMLEASVLLGINLTPYQVEWRLPEKHGYKTFYGWPEIAYRAPYPEAHEFLGIAVVGVDYNGLLSNLAVAFLVLIATAVYCEVLTRRRERKRTP